MKKFLLLYRFAKLYNYKIHFSIDIFHLYFIFYIECKVINKDQNNFIGLEYSKFNLYLFTWISHQYKDFRNQFLQYTDDYQKIFKINFTIDYF